MVAVLGGCPWSNPVAGGDELSGNEDGNFFRFAGTDVKADRGANAV
jgi:hypothetical protein